MHVMGAIRNKGNGVKVLAAYAWPLQLTGRFLHPLPAHSIYGAGITDRNACEVRVEEVG